MSLKVKKRRNIVLDDLILFLDPKDKNSYSGDSSLVNLFDSSGNADFTMYGTNTAVSNGRIIFDSAGLTEANKSYLRLNTQGYLRYPQYTYLAWVRFNDLSQVDDDPKNVIQVIFSDWSNYSEQSKYINVFLSLDDDASNVLYAKVSSSNADNTVTLSGETSLSEDTWYLVGVSFKTVGILGKLEIWLNGQLEASQETPFSSAYYATSHTENEVTTATNGTFTIGKYDFTWSQHPDEFFDGSMGSIFGYDRALSSTEHAQIYKVTKSEFGL